MNQEKIQEDNNTPAQNRCTDMSKKFNIYTGIQTNNRNKK